MENLNNKIELNEEDIVNKDYLKHLKNIGIICSICQNIIYDPYSCSSCQNCFCKECIEEWKKNNTKCPFRCENPKIEKNRLMDNILSELMFKCQKCSETFSYSEAKDHFSFKCKNISMEYKLKLKEEEIQSLKKEIGNLKKIISEKDKEIQTLKSNTTEVYSNQHPRFFKSKNHEHSLIYFARKDDPIAINRHHPFWFCDLCRTTHHPLTEPSYYCTTCDYDLCINCKIKEAGK